MVRFVFIIVLLFFYGDTARSQSNTKKRLEMLYGYKNDDVLMDSFVKYLKDFSIAPELIRYENKLMQLKLLKNTKPESYTSFFKNYVLKEQYRKKLSVPKMLGDKIKKHPITASNYFSTFCYTIQMLDAKMLTREQNFYCYLMEGNTMIREALLFAVKDNDLSVPKQLFYLYCTLQTDKK